MKEYTVIWWHDAQDDLANLWITATAVDRTAFTRSADEIDRKLARDPKSAVETEHEGLCTTHAGKLAVQYSFDESDRKVTVWRVRLRR
jgi:hypothetical protein